MNMDSDTLNIILGLAAIILPLIFGSAWWRAKTGKVGAMIEAAALAAVESQNRERVNVARADPNSGGGVGSIPARVGMTAKHNAMTDTITAIAHATKTPAGDVVAQLAPAISDAIERGVEAIKKRQNPDLPAASASLFPLVLLFCALSVSACSTLPAGWRDSNADALDAVAVSAAVKVFGPDASPNEAALASVGHAGAAEYANTAGGAVDKQARLRRAAREMVRLAATVSPPYADAGLLAAEIRRVCGVPGCDADQILGLLLAAIRSPK